MGLLVGRADDLLDSTRDGEWSLRAVLRHAIAVELRYGVQVEYSATRGASDPLGIPADRLPCDRIAPPEPEFGATRVGGIGEVLELVGAARIATDRRLTAVREDALLRPSLWGTQQLTVRTRSHQIAVHLTESVIQSEKCLVREGSSEARRIVRHGCAVRGAQERWSEPAARADLDARYRDLAAP